MSRFAQVRTKRSLAAALGAGLLLSGCAVLPTAQEPEEAVVKPTPEPARTSDAPEEEAPEEATEAAGDAAEGAPELTDEEMTELVMDIAFLSMTDEEREDFCEAYDLVGEEVILEYLLEETSEADGDELVEEVVADRMSEECA